MASTDRDDHTAATGSDNPTPTQPTGDSPSFTLDRDRAENASPQHGESGHGHVPVADPLTPVAPLPVHTARRVVLADSGPPPAQVYAGNGGGETGGPADGRATVEAHEANGRYPEGGPSIIAPGG